MSMGDKSAGNSYVNSQTHEKLILSMPRQEACYRQEMIEISLQTVQIYLVKGPDGRRTDGAQTDYPISSPEFEPSAQVS